MSKSIGKNQAKNATKKGVKKSINELNAIFQPLNFKERIATLYQYFAAEEVLYTSSFGTKSVFLLHLLQELYPAQKVHFINTTYHFQETLDYKEALQRLLKLKIIEVLPKVAENEMTKEEAWWKDHPRMCCTINKVAPLDPIVAAHKVWISGLMAYQTSFRSHLRIFEQQGDIIKFHPLIDIDEGEFLYYLEVHKLPRHPLENHGYGSIGCTHCTKRGSGRAGRWTGTGKTECGLHPNFFNKKT